MLEDDDLSPDFDDHSQDAIIYYVSGFVSKKLLKVSSCQFCLQEIHESKNAPEVLFTGEAERSLFHRNSFMDQIDRGGLIQASDLIFFYSLHLYKMHTLLIENKECKELYVSVVTKCARSLLSCF